jgi:hypothetical protein
VLGPKAKAHQQIWKKSHPDQPLNMIEAAAQYFPKK